MNIIDLLLGPSGSVYSATCALMLLAMMLYMSWRLFVSRRRKAYLSLTVSLVLIGLHDMIRIGFPASADSGTGDILDFAVRLLKVVSFVWINMAFYQLYNSTKRRHSLYFWGLMFVALCLSLVYWRIPQVLEGAAEQIALLQGVGFELFLLLLQLLALIYVPPRTGSPGKFRIAVGAALIGQIAYMANRYVLPAPMSAMTLLDRLMPIVFYSLLFQLLFERTVELMQAIYKSSITDGLTGLYNRRYFLKRTEQYVRHGHPVSVIFGDIDNFKRLNDTEGHQRGDEVLRETARIAMEAAEDIGIAGRYGGEEIVLLVVDPSVDVHELAEYFRERVEQETGATVSLGYSTWKPELTPEELIRQADEAMYQAKTTGKNKVVAFAPPPAAAKRSRK